ncbi:MAG TPA: hypothetical protein VKI44_08920 [Acetobacteraceae bacterium]|nr:hypothetical protein [Acetobacteraceae bacterium]
MDAAPLPEAITDPGELLVLLAFRHRPRLMLEVLDEMEARFGPCPLGTKSAGS